MTKNQLLRFSFRIRFVFLHPIRVLQSRIFRNGDFSKIKLEEIEKYSRNPRIIVEAGAADGVDTFNFTKHWPTAMVYAIEPTNGQYLFLSKKFSQNGNVNLFNLALSDTNGLGRINLGSARGTLGGLGSSSLLSPYRHSDFFPEIAFTESQNIEMKTLEQFCVDSEISFIDLLWLDVQGKELSILAKSQRYFEENVGCLHIEISRFPFYNEMPTEFEIRRFLEKCEFYCAVDRVGAISGNALYVNKRFL
jgi:FkbM family methyltransferase